MVKCSCCKHLKDRRCLFTEKIASDSERFCGAYIPMTNADRIRSMTDEELAKFIEAVSCNSHGWCDDCKSLKGDYCHGLNNENNPNVLKRLEWLKSEVGCE